MNKFTIQDLIKSIEVRNHYNNIPLECLAKEIDQWAGGGEKITKEQIDEWKFSGLNNVDFFIEWNILGEDDLTR